MSAENVTTVFPGRVITVNVETVVLPNGHRATLEIVRHPGGAAVVALDERQRVCMLRQFRHAAQGWMWELPAGKLEPPEPPLATAQRELVEEGGVSASQWRSLGQFFTSPGVLTEEIHLFLAQDIAPARAAPEACEVFEVHWIDLAEAARRAAIGEYNDGKTALGLLRAWHAVQGTAGARLEGS